MGFRVLREDGGGGVELGEVDGFARFGQLEMVDDGEGVVCHECGQVRRRWVLTPGGSTA